MNSKTFILALLLMFTISLMTVFSGSFTGSIVGDVNLFIEGLPSITNVLVSNITGSGATVTWNTSIDTNSSVDYGETINLGLNVTNTSLNTSHSIYLSNLNSSTVYFYNITSCSLLGCSVNGTNNFTTCIDVDSICTVSSDCCSNHCVHGICRASSTYCGDGFCDSGETSTTCQADCAVESGGVTGGGGAISIPAKVSNFSISADMIKVLINQGETKTVPITISNTGTEKLVVSILSEGMEKYVLIDKTSFSINVGESETINLDFTASEKLLPDVYLGKLIVTGNGIEEIVRLIMEVKEVKPIFDVNVSVHDSSKRVDAGSFVFADIYMINLGKIEPTDVALTYSLIDMNGNVFGSREETLAVTDEQTVTRNLFLPYDATVGDYIFYVKVTYEHQVVTASGEVTYEQQFATASDLFKVVSEIQFSNEEYILIFISMSILAGIIFFVAKRRKKPTTKNHKEHSGEANDSLYPKYL